MKRAYVLVHPELIGDFCKPTEKGYHFKIKSVIPGDAQFITAQYSFDHQAFKVLFEHDSFRDIPAGEMMPVLGCPTFVKIEDK